MADEETITEPPISFNRRLASLDVGDTVSISRRILRCSEEAGDLGGVKTKMRQSVNPAVSRARRKHHFDYVADVGDFLTTDGHIVVTIAVTRTE